MWDDQISYFIFHFLFNKYILELRQYNSANMRWDQNYFKAACGALGDKANFSLLYNMHTFFYLADKAVNTILNYSMLWYLVFGIQIPNTIA